ncbi:MAG: Pvc16 family protein, partial [Christensenellales bacterium]|nr:Pvc16 family protein [Christensenellales bacterium]
MQQTRNMQRMAPSRFQLSFLITAHSKAPAQLREADQYRMLGAALQVLKDQPVLDRKYLQGSLLDTGAAIHISVERPNFDQMIKIWNNTTKPYKLSIVCKLEGILIDSKRTRRVARVGDVAIALDEKAGIREGGNL